MSIPITTKRHSCAHLMAAAIYKLFPEVKFGVGPVVENGFYYDIELPRQLTPDDFSAIEKKMRDLLKENLPYTHEEWPIEKAIEIFGKKNQTYKVSLLEDLKKYGTTQLSEEERSAVSGQVSVVSIYKTGAFVDLCRGPHVNSTLDLDPNAFKLIKIAGAYWRGDEKNPMLTRIYGVAFDTKKELDEYLALQIEIEKRDHRKLGTQLDLFSFHDVAPGTPFWHPKGLIVVKELENFIRELQQERGYLETRTPVLVKEELYKISGHLDHYKENLFSLEIETERFALKPMNCPESTYIYGTNIRSYKDLPLRLSEFGNLHRRERSGTLTGLFRVYGFTQDDAHIYCAPNQIQKVIKEVLALIKIIHKTFGLKTSFALATRPDDAMGDPKLWEKAEYALEYALKTNKLPYEIRPKDAAFYGPKIDIDVEDSLKRKWTVATIQLDFQMPELFNLSFINKEGAKERPVMIHRSSIGSFERFLGILLEHFAGALPLWLAPEQIWIIPISEKFNRYARSVQARLEQHLFKPGLNSPLRVAVKDGNETVGKKIRDGELQKIPYLLVVGDKEIKSKAISVRKRGKGDLGKISVTKFLKQIIFEIEKKTL